MTRAILRNAAGIICVLGAFAASAMATPVLLPASAFSGTTLVDFTGVALGPVNGRTIGGITFAFTLNGSPSVDASILNLGPSSADFPNLEGNSLGVLSLVFPSPEFIFAYRWAIDALPGLMAPTNLHSLELFDAGGSLGGLSFDSTTLVGGFLGGFVGVGNATPFTRARLRFPSTIPLQPGSRFAVDNLQFSTVPSNVPEPSSLVLIGTGLTAGWWRRRHLIAVQLDAMKVSTALPQPR